MLGPLLYVTTIVQADPAVVVADAVAIAFRATGVVTLSDTKLVGAGTTVGGAVAAAVGATVGATVGARMVGAAVGTVVVGTDVGAVLVVGASVGVGVGAALAVFVPAVRAVNVGFAELVDVGDFGPTMAANRMRPTIMRIACVRLERAFHQLVM